MLSQEACYVHVTEMLYTMFIFIIILPSAKCTFMPCPIFKCVKHEHYRSCHWSCFTHWYSSNTSHNTCGFSIYRISILTCPNQMGYTCMPFHIVKCGIRSLYKWRRFENVRQVKMNYSKTLIQNTLVYRGEYLLIRNTLT